MEQVAEVLQLPNNRPKSRKSNKNAWKKTISKNNKARGKYLVQQTFCRSYIFL